MLYLILAIVALAIYTWVKYDTLSPKLLVKESASVGGAIVGATPVILRTGIKAGKAANIASEVALREAGDQGPVGYRAGRLSAHKVTTEALAPINTELDDLITKSEAKLKELKSDK